MASPCARQYGALLLKHARIARRAWLSTLAQLCIGPLIILLLLSFQQLANTLLGSAMAHPPSMLIGLPQPCTAAAVSQRVDAQGALQLGACNTVLYAPRTRDVADLLDRVANNTGLADFVPVPGSSSPPFDLRLVNVSASVASLARGGGCVVGACGGLLPPLDGECLPCDSLRDSVALDVWLTRHPNSTQNALWFVGAYANATPVHPLAAPAPPAPLTLSDLSFGLLFNYSQTQFPEFGSSHALELQRALQQALLELVAERRYNRSGARSVRAHFNFSVSLRSFPRPPPRIAGYDVFAGNGAQFLFVVPAMAFHHFLTELVREREHKLRVGMRTMGLRTSAWWGAWFTYGGTIALVSTGALLGTGWAAGFDFFVNSAPTSVFCLFFAFSCAMICLAAALSACIRHSATAQTVAGSFVLTGFVMQFIVCSASAGMLDLLYSAQVTPWVRNMRYALSLLPAFHFSMLFSAIAALSSRSISASDGKITPGKRWPRALCAIQHLPPCA